MKVLNFYLSVPVLVDVLAGVGITLFLFFFPVLTLNSDTISAFQGIQQSFIDTSISLAGFILAALTIIVAFKANVSYKPKLEDAETSMELFFSSSVYLKIVNVFKWAIVELIINAGVLYYFRIFEQLYISYLNFGILTFSIVLIFGSIFRSLYIMFVVINMDAKPAKDEEEFQ